MHATCLLAPSAPSRLALLVLPVSCCCGSVAYGASVVMCARRPYMGGRGIVAWAKTNCVQQTCG